MAPPRALELPQEAVPVEGAPAPDASVGAPASVAGREQPRPYVLVVDDSAEMRALLRDILIADGCEVLCVASAGRALSEMIERPPGLLITDLFMPGMSGFALRGLMLRRPDLAGIPVIVLSAYWHRPSETLEVADVLTKPLNIDRLLAAVRRLVRPVTEGEGVHAHAGGSGLGIAPAPAQPMTNEQQTDLTANADGPNGSPLGRDAGDSRGQPDEHHGERSAPPVRPSAAEGAEETGGPRPPRPSQAEGERELTDE